MPAATSKTELLAIHDKEFAKLTKLIADLEPGAMEWTTKEDDARIKDILSHRAHWIGLFFTWVEGSERGDEVQTPAPGYKWNQLKSYNAMVLETYADVSWEEAFSALEDKASKLRAFINDTDEAMLYTPRLHPWMKDWTLGRWAEASGASAFRSAAKYIRKAKRENA
ncbi:MAG: ClbS/DfsB family four-helix bundle protein [Pseudomonadota bacterium]